MLALIGEARATRGGNWTWLGYAIGGAICKKYTTSPSVKLLLWKASPHPLLVFPLWLAQEWAWNVFPSTDMSSAVVVGVLFITVAMVYFGTAGDGHCGEPRRALEKLLI